MRTKRITRRDRCYLIGLRASRLDPTQAAAAWASLASRLVDMGEEDIPKFRPLLEAIRTSTIHARRTPGE